MDINTIYVVCTKICELFLFIVGILYKWFENNYYKIENQNSKLNVVLQCRYMVYLQLQYVHKVQTTKNFAIHSRRISIASLLFNLRRSCINDTPKCDLQTININVYLFKYMRTWTMTVKGQVILFFTLIA